MANNLKKYKYVGEEKFVIKNFDTADQGEFEDRRVWDRK